MQTVFNALSSSQHMSCTRPHLVAPGVFCGDLSCASTNGVDTLVGSYFCNNPHLLLSKVPAVIQVVHGRSEHLLRHRCWIEGAVRAGYVVVGHDHIGHGRTQQDLALRGHLQIGRDGNALVDDVKYLHQILQSTPLATRPQVLFGHSMGSLIARVVLADNQITSHLSGAIICGTCWESPTKIRLARHLCTFLRYVHGQNHRSPWLERQIMGAFNRPFEPSNTPVDWLSSMPGEPQRYRDDASCGFSFTVGGNEEMMRLFERAVSTSVIDHTRKDLPIYIVSGAQDSAGRFGKAPQLFAKHLRRAGCTHVELKLWKHSRHELFRDWEASAMQEDMLRAISAFTVPK